MENKKQWFVVVGKQKNFVVVPEENTNGRKVYATFYAKDFVEAVGIKNRMFVRE